MKPREFFKLFTESGRDFARQPGLVLPGIFMLAFVFGLASLGGRIAYGFETTVDNVVWVVLSTGILLLVGGFVGAGWIELCRQAVRGKELEGFFSAGRKYWWRNFLILVLFVLLFNLVNLILLGFTFAMIRFGTVSVDVFRALSFLIAFAVLVGFVIFFSFSNFYVVLNGLGVWKAVKSSFRLVRKEYLAVLALSVVFFVVVYLVMLIESFWGRLINFAVVLPLVFAVYTRFVLGIGKV